MLLQSSVEDTTLQGSECLPGNHAFLLGEADAPFLRCKCALQRTWNEQIAPGRGRRSLTLIY